MKVEIWSDVACPFCYIGKRRFEEGLAAFANHNDIEIEWKSFQLNPTLKTDTTISIHQHLAEVKGWQESYAKQLAGQVTDMAAECGLDYFMDNIVVANTFNAHQFIQFAKSQNKGDAAEEALFKAYFTLGKNIDDQETLLDIARDLDLDAQAFEQQLSEGGLKDKVHADLREADELGIHAVPFVVLDRKYAVSGAQPAAVFTEALQQAYANQLVNIGNGDSCDIESGNC
ncbi:DsbA family oxidoreductase [Mucilaginibacter sp. RS28]|uniref:DsbA family oxidoreductase n=1 Tax=Mucilaginibacter straminoryzae TaxID=2932774 RepID=A0A9X2BAZ6_9SPHI|nr:DsbA family oxidoreductase [Mucilaginibacter straminoryzae]MCJ8209312.1 DsbA family oxidoreductase [Mucilaginibacter straminoryzae]